MPPAQPNPITLNSTPNPKLVTIGTNFKCSARSLVHSCCFHCIKVMVNDPVLVYHHPTWWANCLCYYWQHDKCHNVSVLIFTLVPLIHHIGPKHLFPNPVLSAGGDGCLATGSEVLGPDQLTCAQDPPCKCGTSHQGYGGILWQSQLDIH